MILFKGSLRPNDGKRPLNGRKHNKNLVPIPIGTRKLTFGEIYGRGKEFFNGPQLIYSPDVSEIHIKINSLGGSVGDGIAIAEEIRLSPKTVVTIAQGTIASMAIVILEAGTIRLMTKFSTLMMHRAVSSLEGEYTAPELEALLTRNKKTDTLTREFIASKIKKSAEEIEDDVGTLRVFTAEEALAYGLIDKII